MRLIAALILSVTLPPPFGLAEVAATETGSDGMRLEVRVEVVETAEIVLARVVDFAGSEMGPVALSDQGDGTWAGIVDVPVVENLNMGFELIAGGGSVAVSDVHTFVELGVDPAVFQEDDTPVAAGTPVAAEESTEDETNRWGWLALAAGAAGLALLVIWAFGTWRDRPESAGDEVAAPGVASEPLEQEDLVDE